MEVHTSGRLFLICFIFSLSGCTGLFFHPEEEHYLGPYELRLAYEDVYVPSDELWLHGWFLPAAGDARGTLMFLHGNAENISTHIGAVSWLPHCGFNVFLFDYRGYGKSEGSPDIDGVHRDVEAAFNYLIGRPDIDPSKVVVYGHSLGASMALYLSAQGDLKGRVQAVVAESPFSGYRAIARDIVDSTWAFAWMQHPLSWTIKDTYSPLPVVANIAPTPTLFVHGEKDPVIPLGQVRALYNQTNEPKEFWKTGASNHQAAFVKRRDLRVRLLKYLDAVLGNPPIGCYFQ